MILQVWLLRRTVSVVAPLLFLVWPRQLHAADFLVIENVDRLQIYNKYQQEATRQELQMFVPFIPMRILNANDVMGDGFVRCMQVEVEGQVFYLLKDKDGRLIHSGPLGFEKAFSNAIIILDTAQILTDNSVQVKPSGSPASHLSMGTTVLRVFRHQGSTYCRTLSGPRVFGWVNFSAKREARSWRVLKRLSSVNATTSSLVVQRVRTRMSDMNHVLVHLFGFFNVQTNKQKQPPQWNVEASGKTILCTLRGTDNPGHFEQSTFYLVNEIENIVLGSGFEVAHSPGRIEIRHK